MIIALSGIPGSGKDTIGKIIQHRLNSERGNYKQYKGFERAFSRKKFAGIANEMYQKMTGVNYSELDREEHEKHRPQFRSFAEKLKEVFGSDCWAKGLMDKHNKKSNNWIITDLRFMEELKIIQAKDDTEDVFLFRIRRECEECGYVEMHKEGCSRDNITPVETKLAGYYGWDLIVNNNATPEEAADMIIMYIFNHYNIKV